MTPWMSLPLLVADGVRSRSGSTLPVVPCASQDTREWWQVICNLLKIFPDSSVGKEFTCNAGDPYLIPGSGRSAEEGIGYTLQYSWASLVAQLVKNPPAMWGDLGSIPGLGRSAGEGIDYPPQYSWASLVAQLVKNLPAMWETWI